MGPFANVSVGTSSIKSIDIASRLSDYVITESGFGADLGLRKFFSLVEPRLDSSVKIVVVVISLKAIFYQSVNRGDISNDLDRLELGLQNVLRHINAIKLSNYDFVIALNHFVSDNDKHIYLVKTFFEKKNIAFFIVDSFSKGYKGALALAKYINEYEKDELSSLSTTKNNDLTIIEKIEIEIKTIYGANGFNLTPSAKIQLDFICENGFKNADICIAKTQYSFTDNKDILGTPSDFKITFTKFQLISSINLVVCYTKGVITLPGLPSSKIIGIKK